MNHIENYFDSYPLPGQRSKAPAHIIVVSDLHLSAGYDRETKQWDRLENFTEDTAFKDFLEHKRQAIKKAGTHALLVINGDFIDFLRIVRVPQTAEELLAWREKLLQMVREKLPGELARVEEDFSTFARCWREHILSPHALHWFGHPQGERLFAYHEKCYGLRSQDFKSVYKLMLVYAGHAPVFEALAEWLGHGLSLAFITGNHDVEMDQALVQASLRHHLEKLAVARGLPETDFSESLQFYRRGLEIEGCIRIEHGHRYEWHTQTTEAWLDERTQEVMLPPGSLYNRYLVNKLERIAPHLDNVKPNSRVLYFLLRKKTRHIGPIIFRHLITAVRMSWKRNARKFVLLGLASVAGYVLLAALIGLLLLSLDLSRNLVSQLTEAVVLIEVTLPLYLAGLLLLGAAFALIKTAKKMAPHFSLQAVKAIGSRHWLPPEAGKRRFLICGHIHQPDIKSWREENITYFNSGTWTEVYDFSNGMMHHSDCMTYVELTKTGDGWEGDLMRWLPHHNIGEKVIVVTE